MNNQHIGYFKSLYIIFSVLFIGQVLMMVVIYFILSPPNTGEHSSDIFETILPLVMLSMIALGYYLFNLQRKTWTEATDLNIKKGAYRSGSIVKWALFEGVTIMSLIGYIISGKESFLFFSVISLLHFALHFPLRERIVREMGIDNTD